jgi:hypothetical protein
VEDIRSTLPPNTILVDGFRIHRFIGAGGFGITYLGEDLHLGTTVAIKEYYPDEFGDRDASLSIRPKSERHRKTFEWGRTSFLQEARMLARFRHPSIVRITRVFEANSTAYMVMEFEEGRSLEAWLKTLERLPTQAELDRIVAPLLDALELMHADKFLHRDIAPDNIIIRPDGTPVLLDFGAARRAMAEQSRVLTGIIKAGYSPQEQYATDGRLQGPWSDFYALGATLYRVVTGKPPEEATLRVGDDQTPPATKTALGKYRSEFLTAIDACLNVDRKKRPQSVAELRPMLLPRAHEQDPVHMYSMRPPTDTGGRSGRVWDIGKNRRRTVPATIGIAMLIAVAAAYWGLGSDWEWVASKRRAEEVEAKRLSEETAAKMRARAEERRKEEERVAKEGVDARQRAQEEAEAKRKRAKNELEDTWEARAAEAVRREQQKSDRQGSPPRKETADEWEARAAEAVRRGQMR